MKSPKRKRTSPKTTEKLWGLWHERIGLLYIIGPTRTSLLRELVGTPPYSYKEAKEVFKERYPKEYSIVRVELRKL